MESGVSADLASPEVDDSVLRRVRAACARCGADVYAIAGRATLGGCCPTCGSYELISEPPTGLGAL